MLQTRTFLFSFFIYNILQLKTENLPDFRDEKRIYVFFLHKMGSVIERQGLSKDFFPPPYTHYSTPSVVVMSTEEGMHFA